MRLSFVYSPAQDISNREMSRYQTSIQLPDDVKHLIGVEERILEIGKQVGQLTVACLHLSCRDLGITNHYIDNGLPELSDVDFYSRYRAVIALHFAGYDSWNRRKTSAVFQIAYPLDPMKLDIPHSLIRTGKRSKNKNPVLRNNVRKLQDHWVTTPEQQNYLNALRTIRDQLDVLLNASSHIEWRFTGFHPFWNDDKIRKALIKERKRIEKLKQKATSQKNAGKHGKGNRSGAIPGKFQGVQMRSQLEIRFAAELEKRQMQWIYEEERLGEGNYLVDFHLPDQKAWVEVKGKLIARDEFLLKEVAEVLQGRGEKLYVYTSGKPMIITPDEFKPIPRKQFWTLLEQSS